MFSSIPTVESEHVEFKTSFNDERIATLVAFANGTGGDVYVGVTDKSLVQGVVLGKETIQNWINEVKNKTSPQLIAVAAIMQVDGKTVVKLSISEYPVKPVAMKGKYYKRIGNSNHLMTVDEIANEHLKTINTSWDFYVDPNHTIEDISFDKVSRFIQRSRLDF